ncbi:MAG: hypothetical protein ACI4SG_07560 [Oligosphaeraceae bacterium]
MNKREQARKERIDFVLSHSHVGDLMPTLEYLKKREAKVNLLYQWNVRYAMSVVDPAYLPALGWEDVSGKRELRWKLMRSKRKGTFYLSLGADRRWQYLGRHANGSPDDLVSPLKEYGKGMLEEHLLPAIQELPPQTLAEEEAMLHRLCPRLTNARGKGIDISRTSLGSLWERIIRYHWKENAGERGMGLVFSMLRHKPVSINMCLFLAICGDLYSVDAWRTLACRTMLEYIPDGCLCTQFQTPAGILHDMGCHLAAFHCFNINWLYTPRQPWYYAPLTYLDYAEAAIAELVAQKKWKALPAVLKAAEFYIAERKDVWENRVDNISYAKGLLAAKAQDFPTAIQMFDLALQRLPSPAFKEKERLLRQCVQAARECQERKRGFTRHKAWFAILLEYYPWIPWHHVMPGEELPSLMEYPCHERHWEAVLGRPVTEEDFQEVREHLEDSGPSIPAQSLKIRRGNGVASLEVHPMAEHVTAREAEIIGLVKVLDSGSFSPAQQRRDITLVPLPNACYASSLGRSVSKLSYDPRRLEGVFTLPLPSGTVEFYGIPSSHLSFGFAAPMCRVVLSAIGYALAPLGGDGIPAGDARGGEVMEHVDGGRRLLRRHVAGWRDDVQFVAQIQKARKIKFLGGSCWQLLLSFGKRVCHLKLPLLMHVSRVQKGYTPKQGDVVHGTAWLQGFFRKRLPWEEEEVCPAQESNSRDGQGGEL